VALLLLHILQAADGVLSLAFDLVILAIGDQLGITELLAGRFLDGALGLFGRAGDTIFPMLLPLHSLICLADKSDGPCGC
jgi:hypothetical protein